MMADFTDLFSQYVGNRVNKDMNRIGMGNNGEDNTQSNVAPVTQTIKSDSEGNTSVQTTGAPQDVAALHAPAMQPTQNQGPVAGPVAPPPQMEPTPQTMPQPGQPPVGVSPMVAPQAGPVAPPQMMPAVAPAPQINAPRPIINDQGQVLGNETPQQMVQGAQTNAPIVQPQPVAPVAPQMTPVAAATPSPTPNINQTAPQATPATVQSTEPAPVWATQLQTAKGDPTKLFAIAGNEQYPEDIRKEAANQAYQVNLSKKKETEAQDLLQKMAGGDLKAQNQVMREIRKDSAEGSYLKAYLFHRLGLSELAKNEQQKLLGGQAISQSIVDNKHYTIEKNGQGAITRAWDSSGKPADDNTLSKLNAQGVSQGTHQYGYSAEVFKAPDGTQLSRRTNSITGQAEWVDIKSGNPWHGEGTPMPQRIETQAAIAQNAANIGINAAAPKAYNAAAGAQAGTFNQANAANQPVKTMPGGGVTGAPQVQPRPQPAPTAGPVAPSAIPSAPQARPVHPPVQQAPVAPPTQPAPVAQPAPAQVTARSSPAATAKVAPAPTFQEPGFENESQNAYAGRLTAYNDANKKVVASESAKQYAAQNVYPIVQDINTALKDATGSGIGAKVDDIAAFFGGSTKGAKAIAQLEVLGDTLLKSVPRFEGPQSDRDVASYHAAAGKLADPNVPVATKAAAFKTIVDLNKKYSPDLDWTFGAKKTGATGQTKVINGVTYVNDGRGWKVQQ
jgi:hypothetical protein